MEIEEAMKIPKFKTDEEEAKWWYDNREQLGKEAAEAIRRGKTRPLTEAIIRERIKAAQSRESSKVRS
jgi:hypothetical protein